MKLATGIIAIVAASAASFAQNPNIIQNTRNKLNVVQQQRTAESNAALAATQGRNAPEHAVEHRPASIARPAAVAPRQHSMGMAVGAAPESSKPAHGRHPVVAVAEQKPPAPDTPKEEANKTYTMTGRRDPFLSPVVSRTAIGSGCSTGKKCLAIDQISLRGVVKADSGMIAVVVNALDKAYFLHENDPVFNGFVVRITGDSIIFKETVQDRLGKPVVREVTKKITTPAV